MRIQLKTIRAVLACTLLAAAWPVFAQPQGGQRTFDSAQEAAKALLEAARNDDEAGLLSIFGTEHHEVVVTSDRVQDREARARFAKAASEYQLLRPERDGRVTLLVGSEAWPLPIPLVKSDAGWRFDTAAGAEEIVNRRIGANELGAIEVMRFYVNAQHRYAAQPRDGSNVRQFAQRLASNPGHKDGLYWDSDVARGEEASPLGPLLRDASSRERSERSEPYNGYYYRVLKAQGAAAPGGAYNYVINGRMIAGYALVAWPAEYGVTGIKSFIVNHYGDVYEKDLGPKTPQVAAAMREYNPDRTWSPVSD